APPLAGGIRHAPRARRSASRQSTRVRATPVAAPENAKLEIVHPPHPVAAISEFAQLPNQYLVHRSTLSLSLGFAAIAAIPHLQIEEVQVGRAHDGADCGHRFGRVHRPIAERRKLALALLPFGSVKT